MKTQSQLRNKKYIFETKAGLFSKDDVDSGSRLLIENLDIKDGDIVIGLGSGYGPIGLVAANLTPHGKAFLVDVDIRAIKYAKLNAQLNHILNVKIFASDGFEDVPQEIKFDVVLSNPPSHVPKETMIEFIENAYQRLNPGGRLYFVTETRIKPLIKREFERIFGNYEVVAANKDYAVAITRKQ